MNVNKSIIVSICTFMTLLFFVVAPTAADVQTYDPLQDQVRVSLIDQIRGTEITSAQYIQTIWPEVYQKISFEDKEKLTTIDHIWEMESGTVVDGKTVALTSFRPERLIVMDAIENLEITEAEYIQIVWPELWTDMSTATKTHLATLPNMHSTAMKGIMVGGDFSRSSSLMVTVGTTFEIDRMYFKFTVSSRSNWASLTYRPTYHYAESLIYNDATNSKVGSTVAYADDSEITALLPGESEIENLNTIAHLPAGTYRAESMAYASTASYYQEQALHTDYKYYLGWP